MCVCVCVCVCVWRKFKTVIQMWRIHHDGNVSVSINLHQDFRSACYTQISTLLTNLFYKNCISYIFGKVYLSGNLFSLRCIFVQIQGAENSFLSPYRSVPAKWFEQELIDIYVKICWKVLPCSVHYEFAQTIHSEQGVAQGRFLKGYNSEFSFS